MKTASTDEVGAAAPSKSMKIYFCDICNESIPLRDINSNRISIEEGRIFCANCAPKKSRSTAPVPLVLVAAVLVLAAGLVTLAILGGSARSELRADLDTTQRRADALARALDDAQGRLALSDTLAGQRAGQVTAMADTLRRLEERLDQRVSALESTETRHHEEVLHEIAAGLEKLRAALDPRLLQAERELGEVGRASRGAEMLLGQLEKRLDLIQELASDASSRSPSPAPESDSRPVEVPEGAGVPPMSPDDERAAKEVAALVAGLSSEDPGVRFSSVIELGSYDRPEVLAGVERLLDDSVDFVRKAAVQTVRRLGRKSSIPRLIATLRDGDYLVRLAARDALRAISGTGFGFDPDANASDREKKVKEWESWWAANKPAAP